jgi:hypothetical protein
MFDNHLYDALEMGVDGYKSIQAFGNTGTGAALGSKVREGSRRNEDLLAAGPCCQAR